MLIAAGRTEEAEDRFAEWIERLSGGDVATIREELAWAWVERGELHRAEEALAGDLTTRTDPDRVRQVVSNRVENALRVTPHGGGVRVSAHRATAGVAVLNMGVGGNTVLAGGLGPTALQRFDRDVLAQRGARWLMAAGIAVAMLNPVQGSAQDLVPAQTDLDIIGRYLGTGSTDFLGISFAPSPLDREAFDADTAGSRGGDRRGCSARRAPRGRGRAGGHRRRAGRVARICPAMRCIEDRNSYALSIRSTSALFTASERIRWWTASLGPA